MINRPDRETVKPKTWDGRESVRPERRASLVSPAISNHRRQGQGRPQAPGIGVDIFGLMLQTDRLPAKAAGRRRDGARTKIQI